MKKHRTIPDQPGLYWSLKQGVASPEPVLVYFRESPDAAGAPVVKSFSGGFRRDLEDGEYLLGPVEPPVVEGDFIVIKASPGLLPA